MNRPLNKLSALAVKALPPGKHADGGGLWLNKREDGGGQWVLRVTVHGRRREMGLGSAQDVSLKQVRIDAERWRLDELDFLEVSIRVDASEAETQQRALEQQLRDLHLTFADEQRPKTTLVVERLVGHRD